MCGIVGFCDFGRRSDEAVLTAMMRSLRHRGPDDEGYLITHYRDVPVGLGHLRLSILDLSSSGHQPMSFEGLQIVFNGEIYNYNEIRDELITLGYRFESHSDTEVILKGFHRWGLKVVNRFIGMFAFGLYDSRQGKLYFVRDRLGVKPLYYYFHEGVFLFSSELKAFHQHPDFRKKLSYPGLLNYFQFGYSISPGTIFENTYQLKPGCYLEFDIAQRRLSESAYWKIEDYYREKKVLSDAAVLEQLEALLISASNYRMVSDVPVGLFLSGGYDSSTIAALLQEGRTEKIRTFTIGFSDQEFNEAPFAKAIAGYLGTDHTEHYCSTADAMNVIPDLPHYFDEPFADHSSIPTMLVSQLAKSRVTVALSADGGDELFGGYPKYLQALRYRNLRRYLPGFLSKGAGAIYGKVSDALLADFSTFAKYRTTSNKIEELIRSHSAIDFARINVQLFEERALSRLMPSYRPDRQHYFYNNAFFSAFDDQDGLQLLDFKVFLPDDLLVKIDRAAMRVSLEGREPLLDHRLVEFMGQISGRQRLGGEQKQLKYFLKKIAHSRIPKELLDRPKMGFTPPLANWLRGPLKEYIDFYLSEGNIREVGVVSAHTAARARKDFYERDYNKAAKKLWSLLMFQMWYEKWMK